MTPAGGLALVRMLTGGTLLLAAPAVTSTLTRRLPDRVELAVVRVLGARHLVQGATGTAAGLGVWIDGTHAASMIAWAALDRHHRRLAILSALAATLFALADARAGRHAPRPRPAGPAHHGHHASRTW